MHLDHNHWKPPSPVSRPPATTTSNADRATSPMSSPGQSQDTPQVPDLTADIPPELLTKWQFIGAGGFGYVYRLQHPVRGALVLKQVREAGSAYQIEHQRRVSPRSMRPSSSRIRLIGPILRAPAGRPLFGTDLTIPISSNCMAFSKLVFRSASSALTWRTVRSATI